MQSPQHSKKNGVLYVVATPIGHLSDLTLRARDLLQQVDLIAAEDTRHSARLLDAHGIRKPLMALHEHNEAHKANELIQRLLQGQDIALISDAGTPLISDPGYVLVSQVRAAGLTVTPIPGACALITALSASGLPSDRFYFVGFLPARSGSRKQALQALQRQKGTLIFYESPHRIVESLQDMADQLGHQRSACLARELTKQFETFLTLPLGELIQCVIEDANQQKGEMVVLIEGYSGEAEETTWLEACRWLEALDESMGLSAASALVARMTGVRKKDLYAHGLARRQAQDA